MEPMTQSIRYWQPLERAFDRMRRLLFEPFDLVMWMVLGFSAWLAHLGGGNGGGGGNFRGGPSEVGQACEKAVSSFFESALIFLLVMVVIAIVAAIVALVLWLSSRGKFIYLDNVVHSRAEISDPWRRFKALGNSLFLWRAGFVGVILAVVLLGALIPAIPAVLLSGGSLGDLNLFAMTSWGVFFGLVIFCVAIISLYVSLFLDAFVVPIMYRFDLKATEAWKHLVPWIKARPGHFILYGLFVVLLTIGFVIISMLACLLTCCIAALPYIGTVILLPLWVTYRYFSLEWLMQLDPGFNVFEPLMPAIESGGEDQLDDDEAE